MVNQSSSPLVSVVIPMYNVEKYIEQAVLSVLSQSYSNFEVICIDDESPDNSSDLVSQFKDNRIRVIRQANRGLAGARNTGLASAKGKYIALLDADDFWAQDKLEQHVAHLESNPDVDVSYCQSLFVDEQGKLMGVGQYPKLNDVLNKDILCRNPVGNGSAPVIRAKLLKQFGFHLELTGRPRYEYFNESLRQSEDIEFWIRCALEHKAKFAGVGLPLTYYRVNEEGLSANLTKQLASWELAMSLNAKNHPTFFAKWYPLAKAYQYRYLCRRAVQSQMPDTALKLAFNAIKTNKNILFEEPARTLSTLICASMAKLFGATFNKILTGTMRLRGLFN